MKDFLRTDLLFSLCGLNCGLCSMRLDGYCPGCGGGEGNQSCKIARCSLEHGKIEYCSRCKEFPCEIYNVTEEFDSFITHQNRKKDLEKIEQIGAASYQAEQEEKTRILKFLLANFNDGRKKTFFCLAVNLLEFSDLQMILEKIRTDKDMDNLPLKERSAYVAKMFQDIAGERHITLKLKKKPKKAGK